MNVITSTLTGSLAIALLACSAPQASAQSCSPQGLYSARRACVPAAAPRYIPGHYQIVREKVLIPGTCYQAYVPARYQSGCGIFGLRYRRLIAPAHYETRRTPDRYEYRNRRVWVPGRYAR